MARGSAPGCAHRGGEGIQAPRPGRARVATALAALIAAAALAAYPPLADARLQWLTLAFGALGLGLLGAGLAGGWGLLVGWGIVLVGAEYTVLISGEGRALDEAVPLYAAAFLLFAELAFWSLEPRVPAWTEPGLLLRRLAYIAFTCVGAVLLAGAVLVVAAGSSGGGVALEAIGVAASVGVLALVALLVRRSALR